jgi:hypothetical protein
MMLSLIVIEGQNVREETLRSLSLGNAKQLVVGNASGFGNRTGSENLTVTD